jgi:RNA polymerase sigma-70 factor (ECF subfamily)
MIPSVDVASPGFVWKGRDALSRRRLREDLDAFFRNHEKKALRLARFTLGEREDALDAVQEAMTRLVRSYAERPQEEWAPLFYRILHNTVHDVLRRRQRRRILPLAFPAGEQEGEEAPAEFADPAAIDPLDACVREELATRLSAALVRLPRRQREAFTLRVLVEADVATTARSMGCSAGSVKTHLSRAMAALRRDLRSDGAS